MATGNTRTPWRFAGWGVAAALLLAPAVAMQFTDEVRWDAADFLFAGTLLVAVGGAWELAVRHTGSRAWRAGAAMALGAALALLWAHAAVGILGNGEHPANLLFLGVPAIAGLGALLARLRAAGMARALLATAVVQAALAVFAFVGGWTAPAAITLLLAGVWLASAGLFRHAARQAG